MSTEITTSHNPQQLIALALEKDADISKLEKLMDLQERWERKEAKKSFLASISRFQAEVPVLEKNKKVDFSTRNGGRMNYSYADLGEISSTIKEALSRNGLSYRWEIKEGPQIECTCIVSHLDGHSECTTMSAEKDDSGQKNSIQQRGSTITYLQRYTLIGALGLATANADVDGHQDGEAENESFNPETSKINWGKHAGTLYKDLPEDYLRWILEKGKEEEKAKVRLLPAMQPKSDQNKISLPENAFMQAVERIRNGELDIYGKVLNTYKLDENQRKILDHQYQTQNITEEQFDQWKTAVNAISSLEELKKFKTKNSPFVVENTKVSNLLTARLQDLGKQAVQ